MPLADFIFHTWESSRECREAAAAAIEACHMSDAFGEYEKFYGEETVGAAMRRAKDDHLWLQDDRK